MTVQEGNGPVEKVASIVAARKGACDAQVLARVSWTASVSAGTLHANRLRVVDSQEPLASANRLRVGSCVSP